MEPNNRRRLLKIDKSATATEGLLRPLRGFLGDPAKKQVSESRKMRPQLSRARQKRRTKEPSFSKFLKNDVKGQPCEETKVHVIFGSLG